MRRSVNCGGSSTGWLTVLDRKPVLSVIKTFLKDEVTLRKHIVPKICDPRIQLLRVVIIRLSVADVY